MFNKNKNHLVLQSIKKNEKTIFCEFNELMSLDGKLIKFDIDDIANNINVQNSIPTKTLFLIGTIYGKYQNSLYEFRAKIIDIKNETVTLENSNERITIAINSLMNDEELIKQINLMDLVKILSPYVYRLGYNTCASLDDENIESNKKKNTLSNIVNLY